MPRWAWLPLAVLVFAMAVLWFANLRSYYDPPWLLFTGNFLFATLTSAVVFQLICRNFLAQGSPSLLMLACGVLLWGLAGVLAVGFARTNDNAMPTILNVCAWLSAVFNLAGVLWSEPRRRLRPEGWWLLGGVLIAGGLALAVVKAAGAGSTPLFFVQGEGGTFVRHFVLASSVAMFALSAVILRGRQRGAPSAFAQWYGLGLWLIAAGLAGLMIQTVPGSALGWTARATGWLGGLYLLAAARAAARESGAREISMAIPPTDARLRYLLAVVFVAAAVVLRMMLSEALAMRADAVTFFPAIILAALYGGRGPGLVAGFLSVIAIDYFWIEPVGEFAVGTPGDWIVLALLMGSAIAISFIAEAMQTARSRASAAEAEVRLAEERRRLKEARARLAAIVENSDDAIIGKTIDGIITSWNRGAERLFGFSASEIVGQPVTVLIPPERHHEEADILGHLRRGERVEHFETVRRRKDGTFFNVSLTSSPIMDGEGKIIGASKIARDITARKQAEDALSRSELRFRTAVSIVSSLIWTNNEEGKMEGEQPGWENFTGQTQAEYQGYGWAQGLHPEDAQPTVDAWNQAVAEKRMFEFEHRVRRADGEWRLCSIRAAPLLGEGGAIIEWVGVHTDITEQKRSEEILRRSEERHRALITASSDVIYRMSADWSELAPLDGRNLVPSSAAPSRSWLEDNIFPEDRPQLRAAIEEAIRTKGVFTLEHRVRRADGTEGWTVSRAVPVCDERGEIVEWFGTASDVTERRLAEEALRTSEGFKRSIIESSPDCIKVLDLEGRLLSLEAGKELLGIADITPLLGTSWIDFWVRAEDHRAAQAAVAAAAGGAEGNFIGFFRTLHGLDKWWNVVVAPILDPDGKPARLLAVSRDVTEQRALEEILVARADQLAQADRSKDEFLAMLAHELRNPLAPLRNAAELLKADDASADDRAQAQRVISRQIDNMSRMLEDLLDVSRITAGTIELRRKPVPLEGILTAAASLVRSTCAAHKQDLAISLPKEPVYLNADATRLEQVFGNLLNNACKYSGEGCHISVSAERVRDAEPPEVRVTVRDDGAGIDPELLPHIFALFVQASRTLDRSHGGLGIGLTLVQRLVKLHGGSIEAHSEGLGRGAEFVVHLPILTDAPPPEPLRASPSGQSSHGPKRRILIVDDNTDSARSLAILQNRRGHETRTAFTGPEAVATAAEFLPDVVLLDIGLPGMDGFEVARKIRAIPALTGALLIAMSGYGREEDRAEAKLAGFDAYMVKPVDLNTLRDWMQSGSPS